MPTVPRMVVQIRKLQGWGLLSEAGYSMACLAGCSLRPSFRGTTASMRCSGTRSCLVSASFALLLMHVAAALVRHDGVVKALGPELPRTEVAPLGAGRPQSEPQQVRRRGRRYGPAVLAPSPGMPRRKPLRRGGVTDLTITGMDFADGVFDLGS